SAATHEPYGRWGVVAGASTRLPSASQRPGPSPARHRQETPMQRFLRLSIATFILCLCVPACGDDDDSAGDAATGDGGGNDAGGTSDAGGKTDAGGGGAADIEIAGDWDNNYGMEEVITNTMWATFKLISFDNETNIAITQNADDGTDFA